MTTPQPYSPRDFARVPGTRGRYINLVTGGEVSRRRHDELIGQPLSKPIYSHGTVTGYRKALTGEEVRPSLYTKLVRQEAALSGRTRRQVQQDINFSANWHHLRELWRAEEKGEVIDRSPSGDMAETMRQIGLKHDAQWWVGETP